MQATNPKIVRPDNRYTKLNARLQRAIVAGAAYRTGRRGTVVRPGPTNPGTGAIVLPFRPR